MYIGICKDIKLAKDLSDGTLCVVKVAESYSYGYDILAERYGSYHIYMAQYFNYLVVDDNILEPIESFCLISGVLCCKIFS